MAGVEAAEPPEYPASAYCPKTESETHVTALVTGAAGFLGRHIVRQLLARGRQVRAFCHAQPGDLFSAANSSSPAVDVVVGDIRDPVAVDSAVRDVETVFHVAGVAGLWGPWKRYYSVNTIGTRNLIEACRRHGARQLVYTSSPSVVFTQDDQCGADESLPYSSRWLCHYPRSKALAEQAVLAANDQGGLLTCAIRPHLIWGPGDRHLLPRLLAQRARADCAAWATAGI